MSQPSKKLRVGSSSAWSPSSLDEALDALEASSDFVSKLNIQTSITRAQAERLSTIYGNHTRLRANLCAVELANIGAKVLLQTAGSPRVFHSDSDSYNRAQSLVAPLSSVWAESYANIPDGKILTQRLTNYGDNVPSLPPSTFGYKHIGNGGIYINQAITFWGGGDMTCTHKDMDFTPYQDGVSGANHMTGNYIARLQKAINDLA